MRVAGAQGLRTAAAGFMAFFVVFLAVRDVSAISGGTKVRLEELSLLRKNLTGC